MSLVDLLHRRAREQPDKEAYTFLVDGVEQRRLTYAELDALARAVGARLLRSTEPGERALLLYPPGLDFVIAFFACLYSGVVAVPAYPPGSSRALPRLLSIFRDARPALALTDRKSLARLRRLSDAEPGLDSVEWVVTDVPAEEPLAAPVDVDARQPAFLQYTSGSTADPKGVMVSHASLLHNQAMIHAGFRQTESSVVVGWLPLYHDMGLIGNVLHPLYLGARCVLMSSLDFLRRPGLWLEAVSRYRATVSGGPNFAYELCVRRIDEAMRAHLDLSCWQLAFNGAEPVRAESLERFAAAFTGSGFRPAAFYPCYGLAEATLFVTGGDAGMSPVVRRFDAAALERHQAVPVGDDVPGRTVVGCGRPWLGQEVLVADPETRRRLPPEQVGEIWVSGPSVALGYWRNPQASEETFGARLLGEEDAGTTYLRTGDLGFLRDGELFVTGRLKDLVILRGRNHYPQDLERTAERSHPALRPGCGAAFAVEAEGEERLVLAHELDRNACDNPDDVIPALRQAVAEEHQVAVYDVVLLKAGTLLKTSSGKIRRRACRQAYLEDRLPWVRRGLSEDAPGREALLEEPEVDLGSWATQTPEQRRTTLSRYLRQSAARLLRVPAAQIGETEPLTRHGLDSLSAMQLTESVDRELGLRLPAERLLEGATLRQLVDELAKQPDEEDAGRSDFIRPAARTPHLPLSYAQETFYLFDRMNPRQHLFNIPAAVHLRGPLQPAALHHSLAEVVRRHEALRTTFALAHGKPCQVISEAARLPFQRVDLRGLGPAAAEREARRRLTAAARRPFDLDRGPLLRALLVRWSEEDHHFLVTMHHIVTDGWSCGNLIRELSALYTAAVTGRPPRLPPPRLHYADFSSWERQRYPETTFETIRQQWEGVAPAPELRLCRASGRTGRPGYRGCRQSLLLPSDLVARLKDLSAAHPCTLFMTLLTAYAVALARWSRHQRLDVLSPVANRDLPHTGDIFGCVRNMLLLRLDLTGCARFSAALTKTKVRCLDAYAYRQVPLRTVLARTGGRRGGPTFPVMFAMEQIPFEELRLPGLRAAALEVPLGTSSRDLTMYAEERGPELVLVQEHAADLEPSAVANFLHHLETILRRVTEDADVPLSELLAEPRRAGAA